MSRLDRHVSRVQNKLALDRFVSALAWAMLFYAAAVWVGIVIDRVFRVHLPHVAWWLWGGFGAAALVALVYAIVRRPNQHDAAVAIDERLALKEKFSTALYARPMKDPFSQAAVRDAEQTAENVSLHKRFPLEFPRQSIGTAAVALLVGLTLLWLPKMDLFGREQAKLEKTEQQKLTDEAKKSVEKALQVIVQTQAKGNADEETIKQAKKELEAMLNAPIRDPEKAKRSAARALSDLDQVLKEQMAKNQRVADAESDAKAFKSLTPPSDEKGPVAEAQRKIAKGDFGEAVDELEKAVEKFDKMDEEEKQKAAQQMQQMAQQLQQLANDPKQQQQMQQQMQRQLGMNQQQAQQAAQLMQQAAQGDKRAQQQLQQQAQQALKQMNNGQGPNPQQQQQVQQMMKQMQAQANTQAQAQQMAQAAQQMAQAMKQAQQQGAKGNPQAGQQGQQMAQGQAAMKQQLNAMQAMKADAQQVGAQQAAAAQAAADAANQLNGGGKQGAQAGNPQGNQPGGNNNGQWNNNNNQKFNGPNNGMAGGGIGAGDRSAKEQAPYAIKTEVSESQDIDGGKILASTLIKAKNIKGESTVGTSDVSAPPEQDATDEVEQERISRPAQEAVKQYFSAWQKDVEKK